MADPAEPVDFKLVFEKSAAPYLLLDPDLRIVAASDRYCTAFGIARDALVGRSLFDALPASGESASSLEELRASLERVVAQKRADTMGVIRIDVRRADSNDFEVRYWSPRNSPVLDGGGTLRHIIHRAYDVSEAVRDPGSDRARRQTEDSSRRLIVELQRRNEEFAEIETMRDDLVERSRLGTVALVAGALAHDLSQPLTAARIYLAALRSGRTDPAMAKSLMGRIAAQFERCGEVIQALRLLIGSSAPVHKPADVGTMIALAARLASARMREAGATLQVFVEPGLPPVAMDRIQIQQALQNLLDNAARSVTGKAEAAVRLEARRMGRDLHISVADNGDGLPPDVRARIDEPLATAELDTLGFGLPICRQIAKAHQGSITVGENKPGAIVTLAIPLEPGA
jgi:PAS domain S-box-containing protein